LPTFRLIDLVRDREVLEVAQKDAAAWLDQERPDKDTVNTLIDNWNTRFRLVEVG